MTFQSRGRPQVRSWLTDRLWGTFDGLVFLALSAVAVWAYAPFGQTKWPETVRLSSLVVVATAAAVSLLATLLLRALRRALHVRRARKPFGRAARDAFLLWYVERSGILESIRSQVDSPSPVPLVVIDIPGGGKTWILRRIAFDLAARDKSPILVSLHGSYSLSALFADLAWHLSEHGMSPSRYWAQSRRIARAVHDVAEQFPIPSGHIGTAETTEQQIRALLGPEMANLYLNPEATLAAALGRDLRRLSHKHKPPVLLIDGIDKLPSHSIRILLEKLAPEGLLITTSQRRVSADIVPTYIRPRPLSNEQMLQIVDNAIRRRGLEPLSKETRAEICQRAKGIPLFVDVLIDQVSAQPVLPHLPSSAIDAYLTKLQPGHAETRIGIETMTRLAFIENLDVGAIAFLMPHDSPRRIFDEFNQLSYVQVFEGRAVLHEQVRRLLLTHQAATDPTTFRQNAEDALGYYQGRIREAQTESGTRGNEWTKFSLSYAKLAFEVESQEHEAIARSYFLDAVALARVDYAQSFIEALRELTPGRAMVYEGRLAMLRGSYERGRKLLEQILESTDDEGVQAEAYDAIGPYYYVTGQYDRLLQTSLRALAISRAKRPELVPDNLDGLGWAYCRLGRFKESRQAFLEGIGAGERLRSLYWATKHLYNLGALAYLERDLESADAVVRRFRLEHPDLQDAGELGAMFDQLAGTIALARHDFDLAEPLLSRSYMAFVACGKIDRAAHSKVLLGDVATGVGRLDVAIASYREAINSARSAGHLRYELEASIGISMVAKRLGMTEVAQEAIERCRRLGRSFPSDASTARVAELDDLLERSVRRG